MSERSTLLVTALLAVIGWLFTHVVERAANSPVIEYRLEELHLGGSQKMVLQISNLTRDRAFEDIEVIVTAAPRTRILAAEVTPTEPAYEGEVAPVATESSAVFHLQQFMPGASASLATTYAGSGRPRFRATDLKGPVRFVEQGIETWFIRNEIGVFLTIAVLALLSVMIMLIGSAVLAVWRPAKSGTGGAVE